jgi:hypothetical protein
MMYRIGPVRLAIVVSVAAAQASAQVTSTFSEYTSGKTTEYQAAIGRPVTSGVLDFYDTELFVAGARNVLGTWGASGADVGSLNRPTNIGSSNTMFATQLGEEVDIFGTGTDVILGTFRPFSLFSMDVAHLYSTAYSPIPLSSFTFTVFGFGPSTGNATIAQSFTIAAPTAVGGIQHPVLQTLTFDSRWSMMSNVWFVQSTGSGTASQFTNVRAVLTPEPGTYGLIVIGLCFVAAIQLRQRRRRLTLSPNEEQQVVASAI